MMDTGQMEKRILDFMNTERIPLYGFAESKPLPDVPEHCSPPTLLKEAKSVICYAISVPDGVVHAERDASWLYWRYWNITYRSLDAATLKLCSILEDGGYRTTPIYACFPFRISDNKLWGSIPLVYWAEQAGIGKISKTGLLVNPRYGARMALGGLVTTAAITPTEPIKETICPSGCTDCSNVCPVNAIDETGRVQHMKCLGYAHESPLMEHLLGDPSVTKKHAFETIFNLVGVDDHGSYRCFECLKACPLNGGRANN